MPGGIPAPWRREAKVARGHSGPVAEGGKICPGPFRPRSGEGKSGPASIADPFGCRFETIRKISTGLGRPSGGGGGDNRPPLEGVGESRSVAHRPREGRNDPRESVNRAWLCGSQPEGYGPWRWLHRYLVFLQFFLANENKYAITVDESGVCADGEGKCGGRVCNDLGACRNGWLWLPLWSRSVMRALARPGM